MLGLFCVSTHILSLFSGIIVQPNHVNKRKLKNLFETYISVWNFWEQDYSEDQKAWCSLTNTCLLGEASSQVDIQLLP